MWIQTIPWWASLLIILAAFVCYFVLWLFLAVKLKKLHPGVTAAMAFLVIGGIVTWLHLILAPS